MVTQAKRSFVNLLPNLSCTNLVEEKENYNAHCVFSTYQTMMHCIDTVNDDDMSLWMGIKKVIDTINANAAA